MHEIDSAALTLVAQVSILVWHHAVMGTLPAFPLPISKLGTSKVTYPLLAVFAALASACVAIAIERHEKDLSRRRTGLAACGLFSLIGVINGAEGWWLIVHTVIVWAAFGMMIRYIESDRELWVSVRGRRVYWTGLTFRWVWLLYLVLVAGRLFTFSSEIGAAVQHLYDTPTEAFAIASTLATTIVRSNSVMALRISGITQWALVALVYWGIRDRLHGNNDKPK